MHFLSSKSDLIFLRGCSNYDYIILLFSYLILFLYSISCLIIEDKLTLFSFNIKQILLYVYKLVYINCKKIKYHYKFIEIFTSRMLN